MTTAKEGEAIESITTAMKMAFAAAQELQRSALKCRIAGLNSDTADFLDSMAKAILRKDREYTRMLVERQ